MAMDNKDSDDKKRGGGKSTSGPQSEKDKSDFDFELDFGGSKPKKIIRGAYTYTKGGSVYCEENFEVYRDKKELTLNYISESISRVSTGELLKIMVEYNVSKDYVPTKVTVKKDLGREKVEETYKFDSKKNTLTYIFKSKSAKKQVQVSTSPRFHIFTPSACTSMLYILSKKFDATAKNTYSVISSINHWEYLHELQNKMVVLERVSLTTETIKIGGHDLQAVHYRLLEDLKNENSREPVKQNSIKVYLSRHHAIPYSLTSEDGTAIEIKFLNNLEDE